MQQIIDYAITLNVEDSQMKKDELETIAKWCEENYKGGNTLEIGAYKGMTSYVMAGFLAQSPLRKEGSIHYIVDLFELVGDLEWRYHEHTKEMLISNLGDLAKYANVIKGESLGFDSLSIILENRYDYVFVDGDHRFPILFGELLICDSIADRIIVHDYGHGGVVKAVDRFCKERGYTVHMLARDRGLAELIKI